MGRGKLTVVAALAALVAAIPAAADAPTTGTGIVLAGVYSGEWESGNDLDGLAAASGRRVSIQGSFNPIGQSGANLRHILEEAWSARSTPFINVTIDDTAFAIAAGNHDAEIASFAANVKAWTDQGGGRSVLVGPLQEMNGDWVPYGMDPANFRLAYQRFRAIFASTGLDETTVRWVFAPNGWSTPPHDLADYYPGDASVDVIGISTYNFGTDVDVWTSVAQTLNGAVAELRQLAPAKPWILAQVASSRFGGDRNQWVRDLFAYVAADPNLVGFVWFNLDVETDWRIWQGGVAAPGWVDGMATASHEWPLTAWFQPGPLPFGSWNGTFADDDASGFEPEIEWLFDQGITTGCSPTRFCPSSHVTRGQMAAFLFRSLGLPVAPSDPFTDTAGSGFQTEIAAVAAAGITNGCTSTTFCPDAPVTREQMAAFLDRALALPDAVNTFTDDDSSPFEDEIASIAAAGITEGCGGTRYCPTDVVTRGQMAASLFRALGP